MTSLLCESWSLQPFKIFRIILWHWDTCLALKYFVFFQTGEWKLSYVNKEFGVCPSYPPIVIVPKSIDDEALRKVATFRHGGRFPVLSYYHKKNGMVSMQYCCLVCWKTWFEDFFLETFCFLCTCPLKWLVSSC